jgi:energy-coupling factor transport system permease protein
MRDALSSYHPTVIILYFALALGSSMILTHPVCLGISFACAFAYSVWLKRRKAVRFGLLFTFPLIIVTALLSPLFSHQGATILGYLPDGNPLTLESICYGISAAALLVCVINWFSCLNEVMTSDKLVYLFGRAAPALSLILSMCLRLVPRFKAQAKVISDAQKCVGRDIGGGSLWGRAKNGTLILSIMVTWALENAIETADSMKCRGYGLPGRTAFSIYRFDRRDGKALAYLAACGLTVIAGAGLGCLDFRYFPTIKGAGPAPLTIALFAVYLALCSMPLILNWKDDRKWKAIQSKT